VTVVGHEIGRVVEVALLDELLSYMITTIQVNLTYILADELLNHSRRKVTSKYHSRHTYIVKW
jgi:hypothetical protein